MIKIAIAGNIASGKSTVENIIKSSGYSVYDTDKIAHDILEKSEEVEKVFNTVDRKEIAKIVFSDSKKMKELESIIHPRVKEKLEEIFSLNLDFVFISVPQLFESGFENLFDIIIFITADENIRKERLMKRNNLSLEEAEIRINAQKGEDEKIKKSNFIIKNNTNLEDLKKQVENTLAKILNS